MKRRIRKQVFALALSLSLGITGAFEGFAFAAEKAADRVNKITSIEHRKSAIKITDGKGVPLQGNKNVKKGKQWTAKKGKKAVKKAEKKKKHKTGKVVIPLKYDEARSFSEGLAKVKLNGKCGYVDKSGNEVVPLKYDYAGIFNEGLAAVKLNGKSGFVDKSGKVVVPLKYDGAGFFSEGLAVVSLNGKWGFISR